MYFYIFYIAPFLLTEFQYMEHVDNIKNVNYYFPRKRFGCPCFFGNIIIAKLSEIRCFKQISEFDIDENEDKKIFIIKMIEFCFSFCHIYVSIQMVSINVNFSRNHYRKRTLSKVSLDGKHIMVCKSCFIKVCTRQCKYILFVSFNIIISFYKSCYFFICSDFLLFYSIQISPVCFTAVIFLTIHWQRFFQMKDQLS